jgi:pectin methylesterase-like acyl-CoA thioesterase
MAQLNPSRKFLPLAGGTMTGNLTMGSGTAILPEFSGAAYLGDPSHPFSAIYTNLIVGSGASAVPAQNVVYVQQNPNPGQFSSIASAVASISGANAFTNPYVVYVAAGVYAEPEILVPSGVSVVGMDHNGVVVQPVGNNTVFNLTAQSALSFLSVRNAPSGYFGARADCPQDFIILHKVSFDNCYSALTSTVSGSQVGNLFLEYVDATQDSADGNAFTFIAPSGTSLSVNCENFFVYGNVTNPPVAIWAEGQGLNLRTTASGLVGADGITSGTGLLLLSGAKATLPVLGLRNWNVGIFAPNDGYPVGQDIRMFSVSFTNNNTNIFIYHPQATGFLTTPSPYSKNQINPANSFYLSNKDPHVLTVAAKGADFTTVKAALQAIVGEGPTNQFIISVGPETIIEDNPLTLRPYISIEGSNPTSSILVAQNPNSPMFIGAHDANIFDVTLQGTTGNYLIDWTNSNSFSASGFMTMQNCYIGPSYGIANVHPQADVSTYMVLIGVKGLPQSMMTRAFNVEAYPLASPTTQTALYVQNSIFSAAVPPTTTEFVVASGVGAAIRLDDTLIQSLVPTSGSAGITFTDGANVTLFNVIVEGYDTGLYNPAYGSGSSIIANALTVIDSLTYDNEFLNPLTTGSLMGISSIHKSVLPSGVAGILSNPEEKDAHSIGDFSSPRLIAGVGYFSSISGNSISGNFIFDAGKRVVSSIEGLSGPTVLVSGIGTVSITASGGVITVSGASTGTANVSGVSPISVSSGEVSIASGSASQDGYISSGDWSTFNSKQPAGNYLVSGSTTTIIPEGTNLYFTDARARAVVSGTAPITATNGLVAITTASATTSGALTSTDWNTFNSKQPAGDYLVSGTTTTSIIPEGTNLYFTDARARAVVSGTAPIVVSNGLVSITTASATTSGSLTSTDWSTFNSKQNALGYTPVNVAGDTMLGDLWLNAGVNLLNTVSGVNSLGSPSGTFGSVYIDNIISRTIQLKHVKEVTPNPASGQFASIADAVADITDASFANPYLVYVRPGIYAEPTITLTEGMAVCGQDEYSVTINPQSNNDIFHMQNGAILSFVQIDGVPTGYAAVVASNPGDYVLLHKVSIVNADTAIRATADNGNSDHTVYLEYVDSTQENTTTVGFDFATASGSSMTVSLENWYVFGGATNPPIGIRASGQGLSISTRASALVGSDDTGIGFQVLDGANINLPVLGISNWGSGVVSVAGGSAPNINMYAVAFNGNGMNVAIENSGTTGFLTAYSPYLLNSIPDNAPFFIANKDQKVITVATKGGDFSSVKDALAAITDNGPTNRYVVNVGPAVFVENNPIQLKPFVAIVGDSNITSTIIAGDPSQPLFSGAGYATVENVTVQGTTASGTYLFDWNNLDSSGFINTSNLVIGPTYGIVRVQAASGVSANFGAFGYKSLDVSDIQIGFEAIGYADADPLNQVAIHVQNALFFDSQVPYTAEFARIHGNSSLLQLDDVLVQNSVTMSGNLGVHIYDNATVRMLGATFDGFEKAIWNENLGGPCNILCSPVTIVNCTEDVVIDHLTTAGSLQGTFRRGNSSIVSPNVTTLAGDPVDFSTFSVGDFYVGPSQSQLTEMTDLWIQTPTMGLTSTTVPITQLPTPSGLNVRINAGVGYVDNGQLIKLTWPTQNLTLSANDDVYVYINDAGNVATSVSNIDGQIDKILLGRVFCGPAFVVSVGNISMEAHHFNNKADEYLRDVFGAIVADGLLISPSGLQLQMAGGEYFYSSHKWEPASKTPVPSFYQFYNVSGTWTGAPNISGVVSNSLYNDTTSGLSPLSTGYYTKHAFWYAGTSDTSLLVFGQVQYSGLADIQSAAAPTPPDAFRDAVIHLADIIVQQGSGSIVQVDDVRPLPSYKASSQVSNVGGVTVHSQLLGLSADDHTQYLLVNGSRAMSGDLTMGVNNIITSGTVGGIVPSGHGTRHNPNQADPVTTAIAIDVSLGGGNAIGIADALSRSDHRHNLQVANASQGGYLSNSDWTIFTSGSTNATTALSQIASLSGTVAAQAGYISTISGTVVAQGGYISTLSGNLVTTNSNLATVSGTVVAQAGYIATLSGNLVTTNANLATTNSNLSVVSGVAATAIQNAQSSGVGFQIFNSKIGTNLIFNTISGAGAVAVSSVNGLITVSGTDTGEANTASNLGTGFGWFDSKNGVDLRFKSITSGTNIVISSGANSLQVGVNDSPTFTTVSAAVISGATISGGTISLEANIVPQNSGTSLLGSPEAPFANIYSVPKEYIFAYANNTQTVAASGTFQDITFGTNVQLNGFSHVAGGTLFSGAATGLYKIDYTATVSKTGGANSIFEARALVNGVEVSGSQVGITINANNLVTPVSNSFIANIASGQALRMQMTATTNTTNIRSVGAFAGARPSITLTATRFI